MNGQCVGKSENMANQSERSLDRVTFYSPSVMADNYALEG